MWKQIFKFNKTDRAWHMPVIAGVCVVIPLLLGAFFDQMEYAKHAAIGALVILYLQSNNLVTRMIILTVCGFGMIFSFSIGIVFSYFFWLAPLILALFAFSVHYAINHLQLTRPPGNFFFIMVASIAITLPHPPEEISLLIGNFSVGVMIAVSVGLLYSILILQGPVKPDGIILKKKSYINITESVIYGLMVGLSLLAANLLKLEHPYWVPISCMAVMQGVNTRHIWTRAFQRVLGTLVGIGLAWFLLKLKLDILGICISIFLLQTIVEYLIVRNYALAVIFISMLTIFLVEPNINLISDTNHLVATRFLDILLGSSIGAIGGWMLYHEKIRFFTKKQLVKTKVMMRKYR